MQPLDLLEAAKYINERDLKREYIGYARSLILTKYPSISPIYLEEAESKLSEWLIAFYEECYKRYQKI